MGVEKGNSVSLSCVSPQRGGAGEHQGQNKP